MKKTKAFTMIEILIISIVISTGLFAIFAAAHHAKLVNQRLVQTMIANQLATEGTEIIYQTRNTNFLHYYQDRNNYINGCNESYDECVSTFREKNKINICWLATHYEKCIYSAKMDNEEDVKNLTLNIGNYYIETNEQGENIIHTCNENDCKEYYDDKYAICLNSGVRNPCPKGHTLGGDESRYGKFYRVIQGLGAYDMSDNITGGKIIKEPNYKIISQEYRFCSRVYWVGGQDGEIEICSTMTNFIE